MASNPRPRKASGSTPLGDFFTPGRIVALVVAVLVLIFVFQNTGRTKIRVLIPEVIMPLWLALLATALIGLFLGMYLTHRRR
ncbi:hypothetical protein H7827_03565 [Streptomyces sp. JH002]|jgi:uncharacterized integral membrane protein|uniref:Membrane protein n=1 Tax=Streptomyces xiamenensis TaxID=408015 RepID=A0A0F7G155_9ACTN|nr:MULTISPECIES: hypothetical protein [Streptomyces]AKG46213.1 membrane protein [Streptomyces xiamenensis]